MINTEKEKKTTLLFNKTI